MGYVSISTVGVGVRDLAYYLVYGNGSLRAEHLARGTNRLVVSYCDADSIAEFVAKAEALPRRTRRKIAAFSYVQSFPADLFDVKNLDDRRRVNELGYRLAKKMHPNADVWVVTHADGCGQCLHNHIIVINQDEVTGRALTSHRLPKFVRAAENDLMREEGLPTISFDDKALSWPERAAKLDEGTFKRVLGDRLHQCQVDALASGATDEAELDAAFVANLADYGIVRDVQIREVIDKKTGEVTEEVGVTYKMIDDITPRRDPGKKQRVRRAKASSISADFTDKGWHDICQRHLAGPHTTVAMAPPVQAMQDACDVPETSWDELARERAEAMGLPNDDAVWEGMFSHVRAVDPDRFQQWQADDHATFEDLAKDYFDDITDDEVMAAAAALGYVKAHQRDMTATPTSAPAPVGGQASAPAPAMPSTEPVEHTPVPPPVSAPAPTEEVVAGAPALAATDLSPNVVTPGPLPTTDGHGWATDRPHRADVGAVVAADAPITPTSGPSVAACGQDRVDQQKPYVSSLRKLKFKKADPKRQQLIDGLASFDEETRSRLARGERPVEAHVPKGVGRRVLGSLGSHLHPAVRAQLTLRETKKRARSMAFEAGRDLKKELDGLRADGKQHSEEFDQTEVKRNVANQQRARLERELAAGCYEDVDEALATWKAAHPEVAKLSAADREAYVQRGQVALDEALAQAQHDRQVDN